ncbi:TPA: hypothetical protein N3A33_004345 [Salmonella enterica subsp. salamae serovar 28:r:e,n,z15]|nr:hypothetical protein [Salmonella enterica subsp. salamae serovar 28:r:e,n,z15]
MENFTTKERLESAISNLTLTAGTHGEALVVVTGLVKALIQENEKLRAQLVAFQKAAHPTVAVDLASNPDTTAWYAPFTKGTRVCLRAHPYQRGTVNDTRIDGRHGHLIFVCFESEFEDNRWIKARNLELVPDK